MRKKTKHRNFLARFDWDRVRRRIKDVGFAQITMVAVVVSEPALITFEEDGHMRHELWFMVCHLPRRLPTFAVCVRNQTALEIAARVTKYSTVFIVGKMASRPSEVEAWRVHTLQTAYGSSTITLPRKLVAHLWELSKDRNGLTMEQVENYRDETASPKEPE